MVMGCSGSGKSTLTQQLSQELGIEAIHLDSHFSSPGWVQPEKDQWLKKQEELLAKDQWIMDGNYTNTIEKRLEKADTFIYLDFSTWDCLWGICKRRFKYAGKTRPDMAPDCPERFEWTFLKYVLTYWKNRAPMMREMLSKVKDKKVIILKNRDEVNSFLSSLKKDS